VSPPPPPRLKSLCVFCGSSPGADPRHRKEAARLGRQLAEAGVTLIYGGGHLGIMGALAEAAVRHGGKVIGVIPEHLTRVEAAYLEVAELIIVDSMHTRKRRMAELADAFCILPGGFGTLDEAFEILTWKQLRLHNKPIILANLHGYWEPWLALSTAIVEGGFAQPDVGRLYSVVERIDEVLPRARHDIATAVGEPRLF